MNATTPQPQHTPFSRVVEANKSLPFAAYPGWQQDIRALCNSHAQLVALAELAAKREPEMMDKAEMRAVLVNLYELARAALQSAKE